MWLWVYYHVYLSPVYWVPCRLVYSLFPVFLCVCIALSTLDVVIKDYYFEVYPRLRVPRFSLLCAPWRKTRPNSTRRPFTSFCFVRFFKSLVCSCVLSLAASESVRSEPSCPPFAGVYAAVRGSPIPRFAGVHASSRRRSRLSHPAVRRRWRRRRPRLTLCPPACLWLNARRPASDSSPPDCRWLKLAGLPLTHTRWPSLAGKANSPLHQFTPPSAAHRSRRSREITPPSVGKANPPSAAPSSSRGRPTRRPRSLGPPPAVASSSPPAPAVEWSSQPVMVSPAGRGRIWPDCDQGLF